MHSDTSMHLTSADVTERMDVYNLTAAARALSEFVDELSNWYVRRSRRRFWEGPWPAEGAAAFATLWRADLARLLADSANRTAGSHP